LKAHQTQLAQLPQTGLYAKNRYLPPEQDAIAIADYEARIQAELERRRRLKAESESQGKRWDASALPSSLPEESSTDINRETFTLADMVQWGITHPSEATDTLLDFKKELSLVTKFPVMIAVDAIDALYEPVSKYPWHGEFLHPSKLSLLDAFRVVDETGHIRPEHKVKKGIVLAAVTNHYTNIPSLFESIPVPKSQQIAVTPLTRTQTHGLLAYLQSTEAFMMLSSGQEVDSMAVEYYRTLCSGRPGEVVQAAMLH